MARVQHPNVITAHAIGSASEGVFVAMELVDGTTQSGWLEERKPDWPPPSSDLPARASDVTSF